MNVEIVVNALSILVLAVAVTWFACWVSTFFWLPRGYTLRRQGVGNAGFGVVLYEPGGAKVDNYPESIYGQRGAINSARREAHKHKRSEKKSDAVYQARFEKKFGGNNES